MINLLLYSFVKELNMKSLMDIKSNFTRRTVLIVIFIPLIILCYLYYVVIKCIEVTKEIPSSVKYCWKGRY